MKSRNCKLHCSIIATVHIKQLTTHKICYISFSCLILPYVFTGCDPNPNPIQSMLLLWNIPMFGCGNLTTVQIIIHEIHSIFNRGLPFGKDKAVVYIGTYLTWNATNFLVVIASWLKFTTSETTSNTCTSPQAAIVISCVAGMSLSALKLFVIHL